MADFSSAFSKSITVFVEIIRSQVPMKNLARSDLDGSCIFSVYNEAPCQFFIDARRIDVLKGPHLKQWEVKSNFEISPLLLSV